MHNAVSLTDVLRIRVTQSSPQLINYMEESERVMGHEIKGTRMGEVDTTKPRHNQHSPLIKSHSPRAPPNPQTLSLTQSLKQLTATQTPLCFLRSKLQPPTCFLEQHTNFPILLYAKPLHLTQSLTLSILSIAPPRLDFLITKPTAPLFLFLHSTLPSLSSTPSAFTLSFTISTPSSPYQRIERETVREKEREKMRGQYEEEGERGRWKLTGGGCTDGWRPRWRGACRRRDNSGRVAIGRVSVDLDRG